MMSPTHKAKQIFQVLFFQVIAFIITFCTNIVIIRYLPKKEYAVFTTCIMMLGVVTVLSDSGITPTFRRLAGRYWAQHQIFSQLVKSIFNLRNKILIAVIPLTTVIAMVLFFRQGAEAFSIITWIVLLSVLLLLEVQRGIYIEILRAKLVIKQVQLIESILNISRLLLVAALFFIQEVEVVLVAYILAGIVAVIYARQQTLKLYNPKSIPRKTYKKVMVSKYRELLPNSVYYIIQSQISLFLLSFFIGTNGVADFGALGRITVIFNMLNALVLNIFSVNFSRTQDIGMMRKKYLQLMGLLVFLAFAVFCGVCIFQHQIIFILGDKYANMEKILIIMTVNSCVSFIFGSINLLNNSKSWVFFNARLAIPMSILSLIIGLILLDFNKMEHIIYYSMFPVVGCGLLKIADSIRGLKLAFHKY